MNTRPSTSFDEYLMERLSNPEESRAYLEVAIEEYENDGNPAAFLLALRDVVNAQGGIGKLAEGTGLNRQHLYRALSESGNPQFDTIAKVVRGLGFRLMVGKQAA